ncbi:stage V sporulation protein AA [Staphylospora marina]|uniref:stage V sporulation protein AA n=1 Tax=Staphylospora marina TaxID=2490858 RepID=UPI000F5BD716|nr:stage V sporulation protein AA [Staphylospora marina]
MTSQLVLRMKKKVQARPGQRLTVRDLCRYAVNGEVDEDIGRIPVYEVTLDQGNVAVIDIVDLIAVISGRFPDLDIRSVGPAQTLIEVNIPGKKPGWLATTLVSLLLFIGSGLAIMNFHTDVSMQEVHNRIYYLVTGTHENRPLVLQIPYSLGIGAGMILFFNRFMRRKFNEEPSPMELEVFLYQESIDQYLINDEKQKARRSTRDSSG